MTPESNIAGIGSADGRLFVVVNGISRITARSLSAKRATTKGILYEIDLSTGSIAQIKDGLNYPNDIIVISQDKGPSL